MSDHSMTTEPKIKIENLYKIFGANPKKHLPKVQHGMSKDELLEQHNHVLGVHNVSLDIMPRQIQVVMGLSGSGKSALIRHINRLIEPTGGEIFIDGEDVLAMNDDQLRDLRRHKMSMVFKKFGLLPHRTVRENVAYGLEVQGVDEAERNKRSAHWIDRVGLSGYEDRYPGQLSGGMQQRVGLARGLATDADILLMDEAFSALDPLIRYDMQSILLELQEELHKTIVFITHDLDEALRLGDKIAILRDGAMVQEGDAQQIVLNPADDYIRDFIKDINRGRVIQLRAIASADALAAAPADAPQLAGNTVLEDALSTMAEAEGQTIKVTGPDGSIAGAVSLTSAIQALHS
jgi:glycine betaine/proline transport system ATP-binding protein